MRSRVCEVGVRRPFVGCSHSDARRTSRVVSGRQALDPTIAQGPR